MRDRAVSPWAADDLEKATNIARNMVTRFGMDEKLGNVFYAEPASLLGTPQAQAPCSPETAREIEEAVRTLVQAAFERALAIVDGRRRDLERWSALLLEKETLEGDLLAQLRVDVTAPATTWSPRSEPTVRA